MNLYDSQVAAGLLEKEGFDVLQEPESDEGAEKTLSGGAGIILMNTCSVRDHAEQRVWGRLGMLGQEKKKNPDLIVGLMGCMVEEHREELFKRFPQLDLMIGTRNIAELPKLIREVLETRQKVALASVPRDCKERCTQDYRVRAQRQPATRIARIKQDGISIEYSEHTKRDSPYHAWLPIMTGCDKVCTFCIVPRTRGAEVSMPAREVCREAERLVADGVKWITLLGQNVNSYGSSESGAGSSEPKKGVLRTPNSELQTEVFFPELLEMLCQIDGLERLSFTTSHPSDATEELFQMIAKNPKISRRFHLPLQSGSDRILKRMKRLHTFAEFKAKIDRLRELVPDISITTDIIVGFSGETEEDYQATKRALEEIRFDGAFIYKYSVRPGTPAAKLPDDVPIGVKAKRNNELLALQRAITEARNRGMLGKIVTAFIEGEKGTRHTALAGGQAEVFEEKRAGPQWMARTDQDKRVSIKSEKDLRGRFVNVKLLEIRHETFRGELV